MPSRKAICAIDKIEKISFDILMGWNPFRRESDASEDYDTSVSFNESIDRYNDSVLEKISEEVMRRDAMMRKAFGLPHMHLNEGYRHGIYEQEHGGVPVPYLIASVGRKRLLKVFQKLLEPLGSEVDVVLETSHATGNAGEHADLYREHIDLPVLRSIVTDFRKHLASDRNTGVAVLNPSIPEEVQLTGNKFLVVYGNKLKKYERILRRQGVPEREEVYEQPTAENERSPEVFLNRFRRLQIRLGLDESQ